MEMIKIPRNEIDEEMFCIDTEDDFAYMIEKLLGFEAGKYARQLVENSISADGFYDEIQEYEAEIEKYDKEIEDLSTRITELQDEIERNQKKHSCFVFIKE